MKRTRCCLDLSLRQILRASCPKPGRLDVSFDLAELKTRNPQNEVMPEVTITTEQKINCRLKPKTAAGNPAQVDGAPRWSIVEGPGTLAVAEDGLSARLISPNEPGDTTVLVEADADLGAGVEELQATIVLHTQHARAANLGIEFDEPETK